MRCLFIVSFMLLSGPAFAQTLPTQVYACANIDEASQRHACFDMLVPELKKAGGTAELRPQAIRPGAQSALTAPVLTPAEARAATKVEKEASPQKALFSVQAIATAADGKYRFTMENGQVWRQLDTVKLRNLGEGPWTAQIRKASLGSFLLTVGNSAAVRVERVN